MTLAFMKPGDPRPNIEYRYDHDGNGVCPAWIDFGDEVNPCVRCRGTVREDDCLAKTPDVCGEPKPHGKHVSQDRGTTPMRL